MNENRKWQFDEIMELWKHCWQSIAERRKNEWRAAYTLWSAFAALIVLILTGELKAQLPAPMYCCLFVLASFFGFVLCVLHGAWLVGIGKRHSTDRRMAFYYEDKLRELSNCDFDEEIKRLKDLIENLKEPEEPERHEKLKLKIEDLKDLKKRLDNYRYREKQQDSPFKILFCDWSRRVQFSMTVLLYLLALAVTMFLLLSDLAS